MSRLCPLPPAPPPARGPRAGGIARAVLALALLALAACARPTSHEARETDAARLVGSQAHCTPRFEDQDGWLGGDVAASIPLVGSAPVGGGDEGADAPAARTGAETGAEGERDDRPGGSRPPSTGSREREPRHSIWLFGDSFVARTQGERERRYPFVHNVIARSTCAADGAWSMDFVWRPGPTPDAGPGASFEPDPDAAPGAFFEPDPDADWVARVRAESGAAPYYWPLSGALVGDTLFVALLRVAPATPRGPFALPFRPVGVDLARIERPDASPETWSIRYSALSSRSDLLPAVSLVAGAEHLFAFTAFDRGDGSTPRGLGRLPLAALLDGRDDLEPFLEILGQDGRWHPRIDVGTAKILMADDASEMSVHFDPGRGEWLAVYSDPTPDPVPGPEAGAAEPSPRADAVWLRRAHRLEGPWSAPRVLGRIPELAGSADPLPGEPFCYAAKAHPELAPSGMLFVTWVCNFFAERPEETPHVLERLRATPATYRPRTARFALPPGERPAAP